MWIEPAMVPPRKPSFWAVASSWMLPDPAAAARLAGVRTGPRTRSSIIRASPKADPQPRQSRANARLRARWLTQSGEEVVLRRRRTGGVHGSDEGLPAEDQPEGLRREPQPPRLVQLAGVGRQRRPLGIGKGGGGDL